MLPARVPAILILSAAAAAAVAAQTQPPTFTAGNRTVAVYATVTNAAGRLVTNLERDRFQVFDNGKRQELTLFSNDVQPITIVMLLDRSGSQKGSFELVAEAGAEFVRSMLAFDKARIGSFATSIQIDPEEFTSNQGELLGILKNNLQKEGPSPLWNAVDKGISALRREEGRRVVLVFTDGVDQPMNFKNGNSSLKSVMKRAEEENVMVYAIGLAVDQGQNGQPGLSGRVPLGGRPGMGGRGFGGGGFGGGAPFIVGPDPGLKDLAAATGGGYFELTSSHDLLRTFSRVADELHRQYALGFTPPSLDGKLHELQVKIDDAGAVVRARKRYLAEKPRT